MLIDKTDCKHNFIKLILVTINMFISFRVGLLSFARNGIIY